MSGFDSDIASLLDDVLQDNPPVIEETVAPSAIAPPIPEVQQIAELEQEGLTTSDAQAVVDAQALSSKPVPTSNVTLESLLNEETAAIVAATPEAISAIQENLTTVVSDEEAAALPEIDNTMFSEAVEEVTIPIPTFTSDELMEEIDIRNFGTLVSLTNRRWHAKVKDRKAAKDAASASGADGESFEARKRLLVGADEKLKRVHKAIDAARTDHYRMTLPWSTVGINDHGKRSGARLLPNTLFFDYAQTMGQHKVEMLAALEKFTTAYPTLIAISQQKLGTSFNQNEYPAPSAIDAHFALEFDFEPIPTGGDYQGLQDAQVEKLADALSRKTQKRLENAMQDAWQRLYDDVERTAAALSNPDAMFHYTLFEKLTEHASMLAHLNVTQDPRIESIRLDVKTHLSNHDPKDVRKDDALRKRLGEEATRIFNDMKEYANVSTTEVS
jgi:hypothetical protein